MQIYVAFSLSPNCMFVLQISQLCFRIIKISGHLPSFHRQLRHFCHLLSIYLTFFFVFYSSFRNILPIFPSFAPSVYFYFYFLSLLFPCLPLHFFIDRALYLLSSPLFFTGLFVSYFSFLLLCASLYLCRAKFNESCFWYVEKLTSRSFYGFLL